MLSLPDFQQKQVVFAFLSSGEKLSFKNDNVVIANADGSLRYQSTCYRLFALIIVGHISLTSALIQRANKFGFSIVLSTHTLSPYASFNSKIEGNVLLRQKQYAYSENDIAQHIVRNKIDQQLKTLKKIRQKSDQIKQSITDLKKYLDRLPSSDVDLQGILGIEGIASRQYFIGMFSDLGWSGRRPRVKHDRINVLLDIGYTLLFNFIETMLNLYGFDIYKGVYHQVFYQRKSLVCDLVEPFRPIVDYRIRKAYQLNQIHEDDFEMIQNQYRLYGDKSKPYVSFLLEAILEHKEDIFMYIQSYYRAFMRQKPIAEFPWFEQRTLC